MKDEITPMPIMKKKIHHQVVVKIKEREEEMKITNPKPHQSKLPFKIKKESNANAASCLSCGGWSPLW
jgi:2,3-bisphosphoglycerate-independent phosphoglycerate mutase